MTAPSSGVSPRYRKRTHQGWTYQVTRRETGVTYRQTIYSATIWSPGIGRGEYLHSFRTFDQADAAARRWIEEADVVRREQQQRCSQRVSRVVSQSLRHDAPHPKRLG